MPTPELQSPAPRRWLFMVTILSGSFLLFLVQPMVARMALPRLGMRRREELDYPDSRYEGDLRETIVYSITRDAWAAR